MSSEFRIHLVKGMGNVGHAYIELRQHGRSTYHELNANPGFNGPSWWKLVRNPVQPPSNPIFDGIIRSESDGSVFAAGSTTHVYSAFVPIDQSSYDSMKSYALGREGFIDYRLMDDSCITFVSATLEAGGVNIRIGDLFTDQQIVQFGDNWLLLHPEMSGTSYYNSVIAMQGGAEQRYIDQMGIPYCFGPGTMISMSDGTTKKIEEIVAGDIVQSFDFSNGINGVIEAKQVLRTFRNTTKEFIILQTDNANHSLRNKTVVTPNHYFLTPDGNFQRIDFILDNSAQIVLVDGTISSVIGERVTYSKKILIFLSKAKAHLSPLTAHLL